VKTSVHIISRKISLNLPALLYIATFSNNSNCIIQLKTPKGLSLSRSDMAFAWWEGMLDEMRQRCADGRIAVRSPTMSENLKLFPRQVGQLHLEAVLQKTDNIFILCMWCKIINLVQIHTN
jgi:hypothetical protein